MLNLCISYQNFKISIKVLISNQKLNEICIFYIFTATSILSTLKALRDQYWRYKNFRRETLKRLCIMHAISSCHSLIIITLSLSFCFSGYWFKIRSIKKQNNPSIILKNTKSNLKSATIMKFWRKVYLNQNRSLQKNTQRSLFHWKNKSTYVVFINSDTLVFAWRMPKTHSNYLPSIVSGVCCIRQNF